MSTTRNVYFSMLCTPTPSVKLVSFCQRSWSKCQLTREVVLEKGKKGVQLLCQHVQGWCYREVQKLWSQLCQAGEKKLNIGISLQKINNLRLTAASFSLETSASR